MGREHRRVLGDGESAAGHFGLHVVHTVLRSISDSGKSILVQRVVEGLRMCRPGAEVTGRFRVTSSCAQ